MSVNARRGRETASTGQLQFAGTGEMSASEYADVDGQGAPAAQRQNLPAGRLGPRHRTLPDRQVF